MTRWEARRMQIFIYLSSHVTAKLLPFITEGQIIPYGFSYSHAYHICFRMPLLLTWKAYSPCYDEEVWGSLNFLYDPIRGFKCLWCEHLDQPRVL